MIGFFEVIKIIDQTLERNLTLDLLDQYGLKKTIVACERWKVKFIMTTTLKCLVSIEDFNLEEIF